MNPSKADISVLQLSIVFLVALAFPGNENNVSFNFSLNTSIGSEPKFAIESDTKFKTSSLLFLNLGLT